MSVCVCVCACVRVYVCVCALVHASMCERARYMLWPAKVKKTVTTWDWSLSKACCCKSKRKKSSAESYQKPAVANLSAWMLTAESWILASNLPGLFFTFNSQCILSLSSACLTLSLPAWLLTHRSFDPTLSSSYLSNYCTFGPKLYIWSLTVALIPHSSSYLSNYCTFGPKLYIWS